ncbi:hypothetical protein ACQEVZ_44200 [Dactylosporangium sp. CA-152071]|uniref:hypothetical protein n=1 Tax=Dactylosporangium sp. CA-152071 TaxID=3239933 RepID=UPI003D93B2E3
MLRKAGIVAAVMLLVGSMAPPPALADGADVEFLDGTVLRLRPGNPARAAVVNNAGVPYDVDIRSVAGDGGTGAATVAPASAHLDPGGVAVFTVTPAGDDGASGFLVAVARAPGTPTVVARRAYEIGPETVGWLPLVAEWRVTSSRGPFVTGLSGATLPLAQGVSCPPGDATIPVGGLASAGGGAVTVQATCHAGRHDVELAFAGATRAGDYTGTIDLTPDDDAAGEVALTLRSTDDFVFPLLVLLAGVALALVTAWQAGRLSTVSLAVEESWLLEAEAAAAHQRFRQAGGGAPWRAYSFLPALQARLAAVRSELSKLSRRFSELTADEGPFQAQLDVMTALRRLVDAWPAAAQRLAALTVAEQAVAGTPGDPPSPWDARPGQAAAGRLPALVTHAGALLRGRPIDDVDTVPQLIADIDATTVALRAWPADATAVHGLRALARRLKPAQRDATDLRSLTEAAATVDAVLEDMWAAADGAAYTGLRIGERLDAPAVVLYALQSRERLVASGVPGPGPGPVPLPPVPPDPALALAEAREGAAATARRVARSRRVRNVLVFAAIAVVTVWTGLSALYFDQAFGGWRDYVTVAAWGFGAQAGLTVIAGALDRIMVGGRVTAG